MPQFLKNMSRVFEQKQSATGKLVAVQSAGQPVWTPRDYAALAREGFAQNAICYRCVRMISESAASVPLQLLDGKQVLDEHPLLTLLKRPNSVQSSQDLFEDWYGHLMVAGNAYLESVSLEDEVIELHVLRPDRMKVVPGSDGWPEFYEYNVAGQQMRFAQGGEGQKPILHMSLFNPAQ